jgi:hypothetical protein
MRGQYVGQELASRYRSLELHLRQKREVAEDGFLYGGDGHHKLKDADTRLGTVRLLRVALKCIRRFQSFGNVTRFHTP